jgi:hypothetical protein
VVALGAGQLRAQGNRIDYERALVRQSGRAVTESYVNQAEGLEQRFTIHRPPEGQGGERLHLRLAVSGDLRAELAADAQQVWLKRGDGEPALRYGGVAARDASVGISMRGWRCKVPSCGLSWMTPRPRIR